jgi:hypothetical protein
MKQLRSDHSIIELAIHRPIPRVYILLPILWSKCRLYYCFTFNALVCSLTKKIYFVGLGVHKPVNEARCGAVSPGNCYAN